MNWSRVKGFVLKIAGCTLAFGTGRTASAASSHPLWWDGDVADGWLEWPGATWTERAKPLDGDLDVSGISVTIRDGLRSGVSLATRLFTVDQRAQVSSPITVSTTDSDTSWVVANGTLFSLGYAWINRECVDVTAVVGNTLTVVRAQLGTRAAPHTVDAASNQRPELFTSPPWMGVDRHCFLWAVDADDAVGLVYQGFTKRPALTSDGRGIDLPVEFLWTVLRTQRVGQYFGSTELVGTGAPNAASVVNVAVNTNSDKAFAYASTSSYRTMLEPYDEVARSLGTQLATLLGSTTAVGWASDNGGDGSIVMQVAWSNGTLEARDGKLQSVATGFLSDDAIDAVVTNSGSNHSIRWLLNPLPVAYSFWPASVNTQSAFIRSTSSLPTTWEGSDIVTSGRTTRASRVLRANGKDLNNDSDWYVVLTNVVVDTGNSSITHTPVVVRKKADQSPMFGGGIRVDDPALEVVLQVSSNHWADGWRYGIMPELVRDTWDDQWNWDSIDSLARSSPGPLGSRVEYYDAQAEVGESLTADCLLAGATPVVRYGLMSLMAWQLPLAHETSIATYPSSRIVDPVTPWSQWDEGLANSFSVKASSVNIQVVDSQSIERYGKGRDMSVDLKNISADNVRALDPNSVKNAMLRRLLLWSQPISVVTIEVPFGDVYMGDVVTITEWVAPNGSGSRGLSNVRARVVAREPNLDRATMKLHCLMFGRIGYGYSPIARASTIEDTSVIAFAQNAFDGSVGFDGVIGSYGLGEFFSGYAVQLIERDSATPAIQNTTITAIVGDLVAFDDPIDADIIAAVGAGSWVDMRFARFAASLPEQQATYAWVGASNTNTIDGTATEAQRISP